MVVLSLRQVKYELCSSFACLFYELGFFTTLRPQGGLHKLWERCDVVKITASLIFVQHRADKNNKFADVKDKFVFGHKKIQKNL